MTMVGDPEVAPVPHVPEIVATAPAPRWNLLTRIAFRFLVVYFAFYTLLTQMFSSLVILPGGINVPSPESSWTVRTMVGWVGTSILGFQVRMVPGGGSGDKAYDYTFVLTFLVISAALTAAWSLVDRRRGAYPGLQKWFRLYLRFTLAATMLSYGFAKAIPLQMSYPPFTRLLEPYGNFSLMGVLWAQIGASTAYEIFTGVVEVTCAVLLLVPGLTTVGAFLTFITAAQIFTLNMTYDIPVKLFSLHLIVIAAFLLAPDVRRLFRAAVLRRAVDAAPEPALLRGARGRRALIAAQLVIGAWLVWSNYQGSIESWKQFGGGAPRPPLYGIWTIDRMTINGVERAPLITDYDRWKRLVIQRAGSLSFQRMDDTFTGFQVQLDEPNRTMKVVRGAGPQAATIGQLRVEQPSPDVLILDGSIQNTQYRFETRLFDSSQFQLVKNPRFRWIQENPFNR